MTAPSNPGRIKRYASVISRWMVVVAVVFTITLWAGKYITENWLTKKYTASATIEAAVPMQSISVKATPGPEPDEPDAVRETILSHDALLGIVHDLDLVNAWTKRGDRLSQDGFMSEEDAVALLRPMVNLQPRTQANIFDLTVTDENPAEAAAIANAIADRYKAKRDLDEKQVMKNSRIAQSQVHIVTRAEIPKEPTSPQELICLALTVSVAGLLSLLAGCFIEVIMLFVRASEGEHS